MSKNKKFIMPKKKPKDEGADLPMSKEGSPTVEDLETGEVTYGKPKNLIQVVS